MAKDRFGYEEFGVGMLVGLIFGAGLGLLLAPQSGAATRKQIAETAANIKDSAADLVDQAKKSLELAMAKVEGALGLEEKHIHKKLGEIRAELEKYNLGKA